MMGVSDVPSSGNFRQYKTDGYFNKEDIRRYVDKAYPELARPDRAQRIKRLWAFFSEQIQSRNIRLGVTIQCFYCGEKDNRYPCPHSIDRNHGIEYVSKESIIEFVDEIATGPLSGVSQRTRDEVVTFIRSLSEHATREG